MQATAISALGLGVVAGMAMACEPLPPHLVRDPGIKTSWDCSFTDAQPGYHGPLTGGPALAVGNSHVAQKLTSVYDSGLCGVERERLLFVDCASGEDVLFEGQPRDEGNPDAGTEIRSLQPPDGPLAMTRAATIDGLTAAATRAGIPHSRNSARRLAASAVRRNRFDPFCGCKLHFPGTVGAKQ